MKSLFLGRTALALTCLQRLFWISMRNYQPWFGTMIECWRIAYPRPIVNTASVVIPCLPHGNHPARTRLCNLLQGLPLGRRKISTPPTHGQTSTGRRQECTHMPTNTAKQLRKPNMGIMTSAARFHRTASILRYHSGRIAGRLRAPPGLFSIQHPLPTRQPKCLPQRDVRPLKPNLAELPN